MKRILVFTATYNEKDNIENLVKKIFKYYKFLDILVIDDNSPDNTKNILYLLKKKYSNFNYIIRKKKLGLDTAHKEAFLYAIKKKYKYLITMDADLSHDPKEIKFFLNKINIGYDLVLGSRYMKGGRNEMSGFRLFLSFFGNKIIKFFLNISNIDEFTTSFRCFDVNTLKKINFNQITSKGYSFFMNTVYVFYFNNFRISQIPIIFKDRKKGKSKISKIEIFRTLSNLLYLKFTKKFND